MICLLCLCHFFLFSQCVVSCAVTTMKIYTPLLHPGTLYSVWVTPPFPLQTAGPLLLLHLENLNKSRALIFDFLWRGNKVNRWGTKILALEASGFRLWSPLSRLWLQQSEKEVERNASAILKLISFCLLSAILAFYLRLIAIRLHRLAEMCDKLCVSYRSCVSCCWPGCRGSLAPDIHYPLSGYPLSEISTIDPKAYIITARW